MNYEHLVGKMVLVEYLKKNGFDIGNQIRCAFLEKFITKDNGIIYVQLAMSLNKGRFYKKRMNFMCDMRDIISIQELVVKEGE